MMPTMIIKMPSTMDQPEARLIPLRTASAIVPPFCVWAQADTNRQRCSRTATSRNSALVKNRANSPRTLCVSGRGYSTI